jgi:hypothetical protein
LKGKLIRRNVLLLEQFGAAEGSKTKDEPARNRNVLLCRIFLTKFEHFPVFNSHVVGMIPSMADCAFSPMPLMCSWLKPVMNDHYPNHMM